MRGAGHIRLGHRETALTLARDGLAAARRWGAPTGESFALQALAHAQGGDAGIELARDAAAMLEDSPARHERARALGALGAALRRAGRRREARDPLREALDGAVNAGRCGWRPRRARSSCWPAAARDERC